MASDTPLEPADPWWNTTLPSDLGGAQYESFVGAFRQLQDAVARSNPPEQLWVELETMARDMAARLEPSAAPERQQPAGTRRDLPGRGHPFLVPFVVDESTDTVIRGRVTFGRFHLGGNGAAHGGAIPLVFDEILGRLANAGERPSSRTASLKVDYRKITPIEVELSVDATFDRQEGRKRWVTGRLRHGETIVAEAEGLFIQLLPGQP